MTIEIEEQIGAVERELGFRRRLYPRWVATGKLTAENAAAEVERMEAVLATLYRVMRGQDHGVRDAAAIRAGAEARVICAITPHMPSSKLVGIMKKLREGGS